ncbi:hypothetical protein [Paenibacillus tyrfis]|uniref:Uncharacterized protein n=1 Tax=Paenibacillus tyrfis TaxID=1501230 RepID=A0A081P9R2_9BACL|nr:hypothetical protein [Paenibacillus tyrfis]KEQ27435.1 hypothetical protein ET33_19510 [Paenibacillus tyrfis]
MGTFYLVAGMIALALGGKGFISDLITGSESSFFIKNFLPQQLEMYANIGLIVIGLFLAGIGDHMRKNKK